MNAPPRPTTVMDSPSRRGQRRPDLSILLGQALDDRWRAYRQELKRCQKRYSEEAVHDLRVATRRLISTLDILRSLHADDELRWARRHLKRHLKMFGPLRDIQVQHLTVEKMLLAFPEVQGYMDVLRQRERKLVRHLTTQVKEVKTGKLRRRLRATAKVLHGSPATPAPRRHQQTVVLGAVDAAFQRVVACRQAIEPNNTAAIHRMRVAFKKFRYMVETLSPLLTEVTPVQLKAMKAYQDHMGAIQDLEVLLGDLRRFARQNPAISEEALGRVYHELSRQRTDLIETFLRSADTLLTFWKR